MFSLNEQDKADAESAITAGSLQKKRIYPSDSLAINDRNHRVDA